LGEKGATLKIIKTEVSQGTRNEEKKKGNGGQKYGKVRKKGKNMHVKQAGVHDEGEGKMGGMGWKRELVTELNVAGKRKEVVASKKRERNVEKKKLKEKLGRKERVWQFGAMNWTLGDKGENKRRKEGSREGSNCLREKRKGESSGRRGGRAKKLPPKKGQTPQRNRARKKLHQKGGKRKGGKGKPPGGVTHRGAADSRNAS